MATDVWSLAEAGRRVAELHRSRNFRESVSNAAFSVAEYIAQPVAMLLAAPFLVHRLGLQQYGIWMLVSAILGSVGILSTGFGDATVKYVSTYRGRNDPAGVERTIRATLTINTLLGTVFGSVVWIAAPAAVRSIFKIEPEFHAASIVAIRLSAVILLLRSAESVFVSTLRAFERYGPPVKLNVFLRSIVVVSAVILAFLGYGVVSIMWATLFWSALVVLLQARAVRTVAGDFNLFPTLQQNALYEVFTFGCFSWLQALAGVMFSYADRFLVAAMLGTAPVAIYVLCVQIAQPIHGLIAALFNFLFPHLSSRYEAGELYGPRRVFKLALMVNAIAASLLALLLIVSGNLILTYWMGVSFAQRGHSILSSLAVSYAALAINVVPHNTLLALGRVRLISALNIGSGVILLGLISLLITQFGLTGAAFGRLVYSILLAIPYLVACRNAFKPAGLLHPVESL